MKCLFFSFTFAYYSETPCIRHYLIFRLHTDYDNYLKVDGSLAFGGKFGTRFSGSERPPSLTFERDLVGDSREATYFSEEVRGGELEGLTIGIRFCFILDIADIFTLDSSLELEDATRLPMGLLLKTNNRYKTTEYQNTYSITSLSSSLNPSSVVSRLQVSTSDH